MTGMTGAATLGVKVDAVRFIALPPVGLKGLDVGTNAGAYVLKPAAGAFMAAGFIAGAPVGTKGADGLNSEVIFI